MIEVDGQVLVTLGPRAIAGWAVGDTPMRNLVVVTLRALGFSGQRVAEVLGLSEEYVSVLRGRLLDRAVFDALHRISPWCRW